MRVLPVGREGSGKARPVQGRDQTGLWTAREGRMEYRPRHRDGYEG